MLHFGNIIKWGIGEAVYLYKSEQFQTTYLALISTKLDSQIKIQERNWLDKKLRKGEPWAKKRLEHDQYKFIELTTKDFEERIALYDRCFDDVDGVCNIVISTLNQTDLEELRK